MKVLLINGSPHPAGCTFTALREVEQSLRTEGVETELLQTGGEPVRGCLACGSCLKNPGRCAISGDSVNLAIEKAKQADAFVFGSPVYYASPNGTMISFLDRLFYAGGAATFAYKPGAAVVSARRGGTTASLDLINKYFTISHMPVVSSQYWNMVHGNTPDEVRQDHEGMQTMRLLGKNMAWLLRCIEAGRASGIETPPLEPRDRTNFIR